MLGSLVWFWSLLLTRLRCQLYTWLELFCASRCTGLINLCFSTITRIPPTWEWSKASGLFTLWKLELCFIVCSGVWCSARTLSWSTLSKETSLFQARVLLTLWSRNWLIRGKTLLLIWESILSSVRACSWYSSLTRLLGPSAKLSTGNP